MKDLTLTEEMFLLTVLKLKENAYGVTIRQYVSKTTERTYPYGTLYSALDKLVHRGYLNKRVSDPLPERGGRSRNYYTLTPPGAEALKRAFELKTVLWDEDAQLALRSLDIQ